MSEFDVAVVGYGPTGATLALALGRCGHRVVVFERSDAPYSMPRACHLDAEVARILARHGLEHDLHVLLTESAGMEYVDGTDRKSTRLNSSHIPLSRMPSSA